MNKKYSYLFVDLDDTVFDSGSLYDQAIVFAWEHFRKFHDFGLEAFKATFLKVRNELKAKYKNNTISHNRAILFSRVLEEFEIKFDAELVQELYNTYWFAVNVHIQPFPGVIETLKKLQDTDIKILALSDGSLLSRLEKINALKLSKYFNYLVSSEEATLTKPDSAPFSLALEKTGAKKEEILFVGNSFSSDIIGGETFGIDTVWFNPDNHEKPTNTEITPDYTIQNFAEILPILLG